MRLRLALGPLTAVIIAVAAGSALATHNALHVPHRASPPTAADALAKTCTATWQNAEIVADDGALLRAWWFTPAAPNGSAVLLLHGIGDSRLGMSPHAAYLLRSGYSVLLPDSRAHGESGGGIVTYGVKEACDVHRWCDWLAPKGFRIFGLGESLGGAILLQSLPVEPRFRAIVAECPYATFEEIAYDRLSEAPHAPSFAFWPVVQFGFIYARLADGVNLRAALSMKAIRSATVPVLLIHGASDERTPPRHSRELHAANPAKTQLWIVPNARHSAAYAEDPGKFAATVTAWVRRPLSEANTTPTPNPQIPNPPARQSQPFKKI